MKPISIILALALTARFAPAAVNELIVITAGKSVVIDSATDVERVAVATEDIVEAVAVSQREVVLNGKAPGETTVLIWHRNGGGRVAYDVRVDPSPTKLETLRRRIHDELGDSVTVDLDDKSVLVHGRVANDADGERALAIASILGKPVNLLTVATPAAKPQVMLKVRFADIDRSASQALGANIFSTGAANTPGSISTQQFNAPTPNTINRTTQTFNLSNALNLFFFRPDLNLGATIEALEAKNQVQILAEPNVLAIDGKQASFLAGGEFPYPVVQSSANGVNNVTVLFREFGIRLNFTPRITPRGTILLEVEPEVSALDYANGLTYQGFNIPGLSVRRVKTEIEVRNNQSFAIAGLLDNRVTENLSKMPGLGDIPLFGKLFQSRSINKNNSELMVVVTPELVQPLAADAPQPALEMTKPFLKGAPLTLKSPNVADPAELPVLPQIPFRPAQKPEAAAEPQPGASAAAALTNSLKLNK